MSTLPFRVASAALAPIALGASGGDVGVLLESLELVRGDSIVWTDRGVELTTAGQTPARFDWEKVLAAGPADLASPFPKGPYAELVDSQRLAGRPVWEGSSEESLAWESPLGTIAIPLDALRLVRLDPGRPAPPAADNRDVLVLRNGDVVAGFVESLGVQIGVDRQGDSRAVPADRVSALAMSNEPQARPAMACYLSDGSILAARSISGQGGSVTSVRLDAPFSTEAQFSADQLVAVVRDGSRLVPLASLPVARYAPADGRRWTRPPRVEGADSRALGAGDVILPGPMTAAWTLPPGATRVRGELVLAEDSRVWGDCRVVLTASWPRGAVQLHQARLDAATPTSEVLVTVPPEASGSIELHVAVHAEGHGPIQDIVALRSFLVLKAK